MKRASKLSVALLSAPDKCLEKAEIAAGRPFRLTACVARVSGAVSVAWALSCLLNLCQPVWAALSALIISQARPHDTRSGLTGRILGTLLGIAVSLSLNLLASKLGAPLLLQMVLATGLCAAVTIDFPAYRVALWTCPIILLAKGCSMPLRGSEIIIGALVGLVFHWMANQTLSEKRKSSHVTE